MSISAPGTTTRQIHRIEPQLVSCCDDQLAEESPLEIRLLHGPVEQRRQQPIAVTMRTPGQDIDLALGFLFTEAIVGRDTDVLQTEYFPGRNTVLVSLAPEVVVDTQRLDRHFYTTSSCGVCGKGALEMVEAVSCYFPEPGQPKLAAQTLCRLPRQLLEAQSLFALTGGIHAAGLFSPDGELLHLCEDVGRHNAVDKLIGAALHQGELPLRDRILVLSGRIGFELVQKAAMAGIPVIAAVGAPSSLAVNLAEENGMTLVGFLRKERLNVYCGMERIVP